jgi:hypothetical protein
LGVAAGLAGLEHGVFEILQGNARPAGLMILSMGPPCVPEEAWNGCEPAMTILPSFLITGVLSVVIGALILVWSAGFVQRKAGGWVLIALSVALLLFGGGLFPPLIGLVGGVAGTQINRPLTREPGKVTRWAARLWPWPLVALMAWLLGMFPVGYLFNDFLAGIMGFGLLLILTMLPLSVYSAYAHDAAGPFRPGG